MKIEAFLQCSHEYEMNPRSNTISLFPFRCFYNIIVSMFFIINWTRRLVSTESIKGLHRNTCQVCDVTMDMKTTRGVLDKHSRAQYGTICGVWSSWGKINNNIMRMCVLTRFNIISRYTNKKSVTMDLRSIPCGYYSSKIWYVKIGDLIPDMPVL